ncbi:hypothetical protein GCM10010277_75980 [Streptomyces longisporoflavus]|nr:hypothetical protein GCM10010277_75980 [Streptomyces longisporoflavus]
MAGVRRVLVPDDTGGLMAVPSKAGYQKTKWFSRDRINKNRALDTHPVKGAPGRRRGVPSISWRHMMSVIRSTAPARWRR